MVLFKSRFTFSIVRHPYAKVISHYAYRCKTNQTQMATNQITLNEWVKKSYGDRDTEFYDNPLMFSPSFDWVSVSEGIVVKQVIKLEEINLHWNEVCNNLGLPLLPLATRNKTNSSTSEMAVKKLDRKSISIINQRFKKDFEIFNYESINI